MVWCTHCGKNVSGIRPYGGALACNQCGRILENFDFSTEVTFVKNAAGQFERQPGYCSVTISREQCSEKGEDGAASDESDNFSDIDDREAKSYLLNEEVKYLRKICWEIMNRTYLEEEAVKEAALNACSCSCPEHARKLAESPKAAVSKSRKSAEKSPKRSKIETVIEERSNEHEGGEAEEEDEVQEDEEGYIESYVMNTDFQNEEKLYEDEEDEEDG